MTTDHQHIPGAEHQTPGNQTTEHPAPAELEADKARAERAGFDTSGWPAPAEASRPALFSAKWPYPEVTPAVLLELYRAAAALITHRGYNAYDEQHYAGERGISIGHALRIAAKLYLLRQADAQDIDSQEIRRTIDRDTEDLAEDLETRLAAVLYVLGQQHNRTGIQDLAGRVAAWELGHDDISRHVDQAQACALLEHAAGIYAMIGATDGADPVTTAPAPGSHVIHTPEG